MKIFNTFAIILLAVALFTISFLFAESFIFTLPESDNPNLLHKRLFLDSLDLAYEGSISPKENKPTVVAFISQQCPFCEEYIKNVNKIDKSLLRKANLVLILVENSLTDSFIEKNKLQQFIYYGNKVHFKEEIKKVPTLIFLDKENSVVYNRVGGLPDTSKDLEKFIRAVIRRNS